MIDQQWKDHLLSMDHLKEGIGMRAYGQKDPLIEYKKEGFAIFQEMMDRIEDETIRFLFFLQAVRGEQPQVPLGDEPELNEPEPCRGGRSGGGRPPGPGQPGGPDAEHPSQEGPRDGDAAVHRRRGRPGPGPGDQGRQSRTQPIPAPAAAARNTRNATEPSPLPAAFLRHGAGPDLA